MKLGPLTSLWTLGAEGRESGARWCCSENGQVKKYSLIVGQQNHFRALYGQRKGHLPSVITNMQQQVWLGGHNKHDSYV